MNERRNFIQQLFGGFVAWCMGFGTSRVTSGSWEHSVTTSKIVPEEELREAMSQSDFEPVSVTYRGHVVAKVLPESIDVTTEFGSGTRTTIRLSGKTLD